MRVEDVEDNNKHQLESIAKKLVDLHIRESGKPENEWDVSDWKALAVDIAFDYLARHRSLNREISINEAFVEMLHAGLKKRIRQNKDRIKNRKDQVDKREFQEAVKANMDDYTTKADAIRDLKIKPQFSDYPDKTLRDWLKDIWDKETKSGRPKKTKS